jgi:glycosyltransferase 2 family protein
MKKINLNKNIATLVGWIISIIFLYIVLKGVDWGSIWLSLRKVSYLAPVVMVSIYLGSFIVRAIRWKLLLPKNIAFSDSLTSIIVGYAANNLLPARLGEIVRAQSINRKSNVNASTALASIFVERVFDGLILTLFLYLGAINNRNSPDWSFQTGRLGLCIFGGALFIIFVISRYQSAIQINLDKIKFAKLKNIISKFSDGLTLVANDPFIALKVLMASVLVWLVEASMFYSAFYFFNFNLPPSSSLFVLGLVNLGILIPSSPGYLGAFQYFGILALSAWSIPNSEALACIVVIHLCQYLPITILGLILFPSFNIKNLKEPNVS